MDLKASVLVSSHDHAIKFAAISHKESVGYVFRVDVTVAFFSHVDSGEFPVTNVAGHVT